MAVKPDGVQRRLVGDVIQRFERRGFRLVGMKMLQVLSWAGARQRGCPGPGVLGHARGAVLDRGLGHP